MDRKIRIVDIAQMAGVSVGTVDRVLHGRGRVSKEKREKIESVLKEINYEPNMVARFLASGRNYHLAAIIPSYAEGEYWDLVAKGIADSIKELHKFDFDIKYFYFDQYDKRSFDDAVAQFNKDEYDGVLLATIFEDSVVNLSKELDDQEIPYVYIDSPISDQNNLSYYGGDSFGSGFIAASLLLRLIDKESDIFIFHVRLKQKAESVQMKNRETGFLHFLQENGFGGKVHYIELNLEDKQRSQQMLSEALEHINNVAGGIVFNSRIHELASILDEIGSPLKDRMKLVGFDSIPRNVKALKEDEVAYLLSQQPERQGYDGIKALGNYYLFGQSPEKTNYMPIDILIKENVDYYRTHKL